MQQPDQFEALLWRLAELRTWIAELTHRVTPATIDAVATAPRNCTHSSTREEPVMDGKGNVIHRHVVCKDCGMIIGTR